jgi:hypothetical protein
MPIWLNNQGEWEFVRRVKNAIIYADTPCIYCGEQAHQREHLFPRSAIKAAGFIQFEFIVPTCRRCNGIAYRHVFDTVGEKIDFVQGKLRKREPCLYLPKHPERIRSVSIVGKSSLAIGLTQESSVTRRVDTHIIENFMLKRRVKRLEREPLADLKCRLCGLRWLTFYASTKTCSKHSCVLMALNIKRQNEEWKK